MNLQSLWTAPHLRVYFDSWNHWLYVDWEGVLTLQAVQQGCLELSRCYLAHAYPRVLNNSLNVTSFTQDVPAWLASEFIPALGLAGVQQLAWVCRPELRSRVLIEAAFKQLPELVLGLFEELEPAVGWLRPAEPEAALWPQPLTGEGKLTYLVDRFAQWLESEADEAALASA